MRLWLSPWSRSSNSSPPWSASSTRQWCVGVVNECRYDTIDGCDICWQWVSQVARGRRMHAHAQHLHFPHEADPGPVVGVAHGPIHHFDCDELSSVPILVCRLQHGRQQARRAFFMLLGQKNALAPQRETARAQMWCRRPKPMYAPVPSLSGATLTA